MASDKAWLKAQAEYRAGESLASIAKKYKIGMRELIKRIGAEGWTRAGAEPKQNTNLPSTEVQERNERVNEAIDEALADIIIGHRSISREMRTNLEAEIAEYQELKQYFVSALDKSRIEELMLRGTSENGDNPQLVDHLKKCLEAFAKRVQSLDKLVRLSALVVSTEREVWNIGANPDGDDNETYDDLLELCRQPVGPRALPPGVADFERKLAEQRGGH